MKVNTWGLVRRRGKHACQAIRLKNMDLLFDFLGEVFSVNHWTN